MATTERAYDRGKRRGDRNLQTFGADVRNARLSLGLSQRALGQRVRMPASKLSRMERAKLPSLTLNDASIVASAVGLDLSVKTYPGGTPIRDTANARRLQVLLKHVGRPLRSRTEVALPDRDGLPDQRSWDATISDHDDEMGVEVEIKLYDAQAQTRRIHLKWRDSRLARLLVVVADTKANRRVLREFEEYFADLPRLNTKLVLAQLQEGVLPPSGLLVL